MNMLVIEMSQFRRIHSIIVLTAALWVSVPASAQAQWWPETVDLAFLELAEEAPAQRVSTVGIPEAWSLAGVFTHAWPDGFGTLQAYGAGVAFLDMPIESEQTSFEFGLRVVQGAADLVLRDSPWGRYVLLPSRPTAFEIDWDVASTSLTFECVTGRSLAVLLPAASCSCTAPEPLKEAASREGHATWTCNSDSAAVTVSCTCAP